MIRVRHDGIAEDQRQAVAIAIDRVLVRVEPVAHRQLLYGIPVALCKRAHDGTAKMVPHHSPSNRVAAVRV